MVMINHKLINIPNCSSEEEFWASDGDISVSVDHNTRKMKGTLNSCYTDSSDNDGFISILEDKELGGIVTIKNMEEIKMKIEIMQMNVDLKNGVYKKVAFTGHRPDKLGGYAEGRRSAIRKMIRAKLDEVCSYLIRNCSTNEFMQGMAQGVDQDAGDVILNIVDNIAKWSDCENISVVLHAAIPYPGQESVWPKAAQTYYDGLYDRIADQGCNEEYEEGYIHFVHEERPKTKWNAIKWLDDRNHYMIDWCDLLIGVWDGTPGGTNNAIQYAKGLNKPILLLRFTI
jgi:hypothetical protein